jgi:hypothetical protein
MSLNLVLASIESPQAVNWKGAVLAVGHECVGELAALRAMIVCLEGRTNERIIEMGKLYDAELEVLANALERGLLSAQHFESLGN